MSATGLSGLNLQFGRVGFFKRLRLHLKINVFKEFLLSTQYFVPIWEHIPMIIPQTRSSLKFHIYTKVFFRFRYEATIIPNPGTKIEYYLVPFLITLSLAFFAIVLFLLFRVIRACFHRSKNRLSRDVLNRLPEIRFSEGKIRDTGFFGSMICRHLVNCNGKALMFICF